MKIELCDMCKQNEPSKKFKVKMSRRGAWMNNGYVHRWCDDIWQPYEKIAICKNCANKLFSVFEEGV